MISNSLTKYNTRSQSSILRSISFSRPGLTGFLHGGRRYFSRREIIALVGGPGNVAVYRHILVISSTAKVVTAEIRKTAYRQNITAEKIPPYFGFTASAKKIPPTLDTAKRAPPILDTAQMVPPTLDTGQKVLPRPDTAQKVPPILDTAQNVPPTLDTVQKVQAFLSVFVLCSLFFLVLR